MSLMKVTGRAIAMTMGLIVGYFILAGPYYTIIDEFRDICLSYGDATMNTFIAWAYPVFYYGLPSVVVFGILVVALSLYTAIRRRYYSTEERVTYSS